MEVHICTCLCVSLGVPERHKHNRKMKKHAKVHREREHSEQKLKVLGVIPARKTLETPDKETAFYFWISSALKEIAHCTASFQINKIATIPNSSSSSPPGGTNLQDLEHQELGSCIQTLMKALSVSIDKIVKIQRLDLVEKVDCRSHGTRISCAISHNNFSCL